MGSRAHPDAESACGPGAILVRSAAECVRLRGFGDGGAGSAEGVGTHGHTRACVGILILGHTRPYSGILGHAWASSGMRGHTRAYLGMRGHTSASAGCVRARAGTGEAAELGRARPSGAECGRAKCVRVRASAGEIVQMRAGACESVHERVGTCGSHVFTQDSSGCRRCPALYPLCTSLPQDV